MRLEIVPLAKAGVRVLPADIVWNGFVGDFALGVDGRPVARDPLKTAVLMLLFTDVECAETDLRVEHAGDRRGWIGDAFDIDAGAGEAALGSRLWLYRRHELSDMTAMEMAAEARRALQPLIAQGAAASVDVAAWAMKSESQVRMTVALKSRDGATIYSDQFDLLWAVRNAV